MQDVLMGCDPELFVRDTNTQRFISPHALVPGRKHNPYPVDKGALQVDGMALEFNIDPAENLEQFITNISTVQQLLEVEAKKVNPDIEFIYTPYVIFEQEEFEKAPPENMVLGCDPDLDVYRDAFNEPPQPPMFLRTAAGHIHIGWCEDKDPFTADHILDCKKVCKQLDMALYYPSLLFDKDPTRRLYYGRKGSFRPKPYGMEYRVLSNLWVNDLALQAWVYRTTRHALRLLDQKRYLWEQRFPMDFFFNPLAMYRHLHTYFDFPSLPPRYVLGLNENAKD